MHKIYTGDLDKVGIMVECSNDDCEFATILPITDMMTRQGDDVQCPDCDHSLQIADNKTLYEI